MGYATRAMDNNVGRTPRGRESFLKSPSVFDLVNAVLDWQCWYHLTEKTPDPDPSDSDSFQ